MFAAKQLHIHTVKALHLGNEHRRTNVYFDCENTDIFARKTHSRSVIAVCMNDAYECYSFFLDMNGTLSYFLFRLENVAYARHYSLLHYNVA